MTAWTDIDGCVYCTHCEQLIHDPEAEEDFDCDCDCDRDDVEDEEFWHGAVEDDYSEESYP